MALQKKLLNCNRNCDGKILKLWRKSTICNGNCDGKLSVTVSFVTNLIVTDPSQFVTEIVTEKIPSQFFVTDNLWRTYSVTEIVTDVFRHNPKLWRKLWRNVRHNFRKRNLTWGGFCDGVGKIRHNFVTDSVTFRHKLWRTFTIPSQFVTENCDGSRHNLVLWRNSVTNSVTILWVRRKKLFKTLTVFRLNAIVQCNKNWLNYHNRCIERRSNNKIHSN